MPKKFSSEEERRAYNAEYARRYRAENPEKVRAAKKKYYASDKGKLQKKKEEAALVASGIRAQIEAKRAQKPLSEARKACRKKWASQNKHYNTADRAKRRTLEKETDMFSFWVLQEAVHLCRLRERMLGGKWHVDHIQPVSKGGDSYYTNLQVVPALWNRRKSNVHTERFIGA